MRKAEWVGFSLPVARIRAVWRGDREADQEPTT